MKRLFLIKRLLSAALSVLLLAMLLSGCAKAPAETEFTGSNQGDDINTVNETKSSIAPSSKPNQQKNTETVEYSYQYTNMKLELPADWEYDIMAAAEDENGGTVDAPANEPANYFGIQFWPKAQPSMTISLYYHVDGIGLCGTGVTFEDITFENGLTATKCTEGMGDNFWFFLIYHDVPGTYTVEYAFSKDLWSEYEDEIMTILESVEIGKDILSETEAIEIAKAEYTVSYDTVGAHFNYDDGVWKITFSTNSAGEDQTILIDAQGKIQDSLYGE